MVHGRSQEPNTEDDGRLLLGGAACKGVGALCSFADAGVSALPALGALAAECIVECVDGPIACDPARGVAWLRLPSPYDACDALRVEVPTSVG